MNASSSLSLSFGAPIDQVVQHEPETLNAFPNYTEESHIEFIFNSAEFYGKESSLSVVLEKLEERLVFHQ